MQFAATTIANLWIPDIWLNGVAEAINNTNALITSPAIVRSPVFDERASFGGTTVDIPNFREPNYDDEQQVASTAPTINNLTSGTQVAPIINRVSAIGVDSLAQQLSMINGASQDPLSYAFSILGGLRLRQRQKTLVSILAGVFGTGAGAFNALRTASFVEVVGNQTTAHFLDSDLFLDATNKLGVTKEKLTAGGVIIMHPQVETNLNKQDQIDYVKDSSGQIVLRMYKGLPIFLDNTLVRAGTTSGNVYTTYVLAPGSVAMGDKPQSNVVGDMASLLKKESEDTNVVSFFDRTRFILHPYGAKWKGTPASDHSPTNAELATQTNWESALADVTNAGAIQIVTNG